MLAVSTVDLWPLCPSTRRRAESRLQTQQVLSHGRAA